MTSILNKVAMVYTIMVLADARIRLSELGVSNTSQFDRVRFLQA